MGIKTINMDGFKFGQNKLVIDEMFQLEQGESIEAKYKIYDVEDANLSLVYRVIDGYGLVHQAFMWVYAPSVYHCELAVRTYSIINHFEQCMIEKGLYIDLELLSCLTYTKTQESNQPVLEYLFTVSYTDRHAENNFQLEGAFRKQEKGAKS